MTQKLTPKKIDVFALGSDADTMPFGDFDKTHVTKDPDALQANALAIAGGWKKSVQPRTTPDMNHFNALQYLTTYKLKEFQQQGMPVFINTETYHEKSIVRKDGTYELYGSKTNNNNNKQLPNAGMSNTHWKFLANLADIGGLKKNDIYDNATWKTSSTIEWYGEARSADNTTDLIVQSLSPLTATLSGSPSNATRHMFVGYNNDPTPILVAEFTDDKTGGTGLSTIVGAKRRVLTVITDGVGNIIPIDTKTYASGAIKSKFIERVRLYGGSGTNGLLFNSIAPIDTDIELSMFGSKSGVGAVFGIVDSSSLAIPAPTSTGVADIFGSAALASSGSTTNKVINNKTTQLKFTTRGTFTLLEVGLISYTDERND